MLAKNAKKLFAASIIFLLVAIILAAWGFPSIVNKQIQKNVQIENSSKMFDKWVKMPIPLDFKVYVFNVTNPDEVNKGMKPSLAQIGPYVYKEYREKTILGYGANDTVKYMLKKHFEFDQAASGSLTEDDEITVINFSYMAALLTILDMMPSLVPMVNKALEQFFPNLTDPFMRVRVKDLFFDGIFLSCDGDSAALGLVCGKIRADMPPTMRQAGDANGFYFSMFSHMNRSESGPYEMVRGTQDIRDLGHIVSYKDKKAMAMWGDEYCSMLNGSDSSVFPPIDESNVPERLYIFEPDICRSLYASLVGKSSIFNISAYYYEIDESALAAKSANPNNRCFCKKNWSASHDGCLLMGLLNLMACQGAPAIASLPHFYLASEELLEYFADGISPDKEKHNTYVYIDPVTGVVLKGVRRLQFNIELRQVPDVPQLRSVPTGLFPMLWLEEVTGVVLKGVRRLQFNIELRQVPDVPQLRSVPTGLFPMLWLEEGAEINEEIQEELKQSHRLLSYVELARWLLLAAAACAALAAGAAVARGARLCASTNSVSFIMRPGSHVNKGFQ